MGQFLDALRSRPPVEFIGGPLDGAHLLIDPDQHPTTVRVTFESDEGGAVVVDVYFRDAVEVNKFRFVRREVGTPQTAE